MGRLPDGAKGADHIREVFGRMGFTDQVGDNVLRYEIGKWER